MYIVGLAGGIGSGKTAVSDRFQQLGIEVIDADVAARTVVEPGQPALAKICAQFGDDILLADGQLDRAQLRQRIFSDPEAKSWLEGLLHPLIGEEIFRQLGAARSHYCLFVSPLLFESGQNSLCDRVLLVDVPREIQLSRTMARDNNSRGQVEAILAQQASRETRLEQADDVILNDRDLDHLEGEVARLHRYYLLEAERKADASS
ncbi:dephospho-CoA kinase [Sinobacterium caligoides]|uniref:Dephospho-CoA kinase n=1 Tax=Sinobacterium caligoides TaxID=933926 RepID=A0A3N2D4R9_9GAMM|nr:dephospho-CoA kinase [Sinobacterium caligoides]ROR94769.1 dephospho-CoA kinase [Sinobacterium caligoides]